LLSLSSLFVIMIVAAVQDNNGGSDNKYIDNWNNVSNFNMDATDNDT